MDIIIGLPRGVYAFIMEKPVGAVSVTQALDIGGSMIRVTGVPEIVMAIMYLLMAI